MKKSFSCMVVFFFFFFFGSGTTKKLCAVLHLTQCFFLFVPFNFCVENCNKIYSTNLTMFLFCSHSTIDMFCYELSHWSAPDKSSNQQPSNSARPFSSFTTDRDHFPAKYCSKSPFFKKLTELFSEVEIKVYNTNIQSRVH